MIQIGNFIDSSFSNHCLITFSYIFRFLEYDNWPEYDYQCDEYPDQFSGALKESYSNISQPSMESMDPEVVRDAKRLIADPTRKEPPSSGKVKVPRRRQHSTVEETWNPRGHSTRIGNQ